MLTAPWRSNPLIYEINAWTWLHSLRATSRDVLTLADIPAETLDELAAWGYDAVWLMGVWERSPAGRLQALAHPGLLADYRRALPDFSAHDVIGSPFAVRRYAVDPHLGGPDALATLRARLAGRGIRLILDFVPNHVARDHDWLQSAPDCLLQGTGRDVAEHPETFFAGPEGRIFAHGRDPHFPPWTDTAQVNAFNPVARERLATTLLEIAGQCDGVRCDMAMLVTNEVFARTWGDRAGPIPEAEFWETVIPAVKEQSPEFLFIAEVYWDMEGELLRQGFDYVYDKPLYDRLAEGAVRAVWDHLRADVNYQQRTVRFIENHDELRAMEVFGAPKGAAAATLVTTLPGATLLHEGQLAGHRVRLPVQLGRRPPEADDPQVLAFYRALLAEVRHPVYHEGAWQLLETSPAWDLNATHRNLIAYAWRLGDERRLIVVNYAGASAQGRVRLAGYGLEGQTWTLRDALSGNEYVRNGDEMAREGLYVDLPPWGIHLLRFECSQPRGQSSRS
ncbi:MAG: alpha-amylase family glycosyl hydrolase [Anaerolineae bacterium]